VVLREKLYVEKKKVVEEGDKDLEHVVKGEGRRKKKMKGPKVETDNEKKMNW
jgi:hypothetical protein